MPTEITDITGTTGNATIDALLGTKESLMVPVEQRADLVGQSTAKWGGVVGTGAELTFSFFDGSSIFPDGYNQQYVESIGVMPASLKEHVRAALDMWAMVADVSFTKVAEDGATVGDLRIGVSLSNPNLSSGFSSFEAVPPATPVTAMAGDMFLSSGFANRADKEFQPSQFGFLTLMHEIGHSVFGLTDVTTNAGLNGEKLSADLNFIGQTIMSYSVIPGATVGDGSVNQGGLSYAPTTPMVLDIMAAQWLYGANNLHATGNNLYLFSDQMTYYQTIWDAGGDDTISVAGNRQDAIIDLREGMYSDVGSQIVASPASGPDIITKTVGIAYNAVIENAIGGAGSDTLVGNAANNVMTGGGGNDVIDAGDGIDTVRFSGSRDDYTLFKATDGSYTVTDMIAGRDGVDTVINAENFQFLDQTFDLSANVSLTELFASNPDTARGLTSAYELLLAGVPNEAGFKFLINGAVSTNFGAGAGVSFNQENIFINLVNNLVQGNADAKARFDALATGTSLQEKVTSLYNSIIPASKQSADGLAFITRADGLKFYQDVAAERGVAGTDGAAIVSLASLLKIAVTGDFGIGNSVNDLIKAVGAGSAAIPAAGTTLTALETADGTAFDADDAVAMARIAAPAPSSEAYANSSEVSEMAFASSVSIMGVADNHDGGWAG